MATRETAQTRIAVRTAAAGVTLTSDELRLCLDDASRPDGTVWAARALFLAFDLAWTKAAQLADFNADGTSVAQSQVVANLKALRDSAFAGQMKGSD